MFSVANLLDSAKAKAGIESDYRLAKIIGITHSVVSSYRLGKSMPNDKILSQICALSGDDVAVVAAQIQAERSQSPEGRSMWLMIAQRLSSDRRRTVRAVSTAILSVLFSIVLIASPSGSARAAGLDHIKAVSLNCLYIVSSSFLSVCVLIHQERLRWRTGLPGFFWLRAAASWA